jgi:hypothetical protein
MIAAAILSILILLLPSLRLPRAAMTRLHLRGARGPCQTLECVGCGRFVHFARRAGLSSCTEHSLFIKGFLFLNNDTQQSNRIAGEVVVIVRELNVGKLTFTLIEAQLQYSK